MELRHIIAATDDSREGRAALVVGARLGQRCRSKVTALTVLDRDQDGDSAERAFDGFARSVRSVLKPLLGSPKVEVAVEMGIPGVEICRFAETSGADLLVIGRKHRSEMLRLLIGDTADAVVRRSAVPCLFVSDAEQRFDRVLVALDGTERGLAVLTAAAAFARATGATLRGVSVEPAHESERGAPHVLRARSERLVEVVRGMVKSFDMGRGAWDDRDVGTGEGPLVIHRGPILPQVLQEVDMSGSNILVVGYHRGGPAAVMDGGSIARRLTHEASCGVLTVPL